MPTCKKCSSYFPNKMEINGKKRTLNRRSYCLDCSPWKAHNTRKLETEASANCKCSSCGKKFLYDRKKGHTKTKCGSCMSNNRRTKLKEKMVKYKGGCCQICGYNKCLQVLGFHHTNPTSKDFIISGNHCRKWEIVKTELDKCILVCSNCHGEIHAGIITPTGN